MYVDVRKQLSASRFFGELSAASIEKLAAICFPKNCGRKEVLFREGTEGHALYLLVFGDVRLYKTSAEGREIVMKHIRPGEVFGEVVLYERDTYPVTAATLTGSRLLVLPRHQVHCLMEDSGFRTDFIRLLMAKQRYLTERIMLLSSLNPEERLFAFLAERYGRGENYRIDISRKEIASVLGITPETLSRMTKKLKRSGLIRWEGKSLSVSPSVWKDIPGTDKGA